MPPLPFDFTDLDDQLEARFLQRGLDYFQRGMVMRVNLQHEGRVITGKVRGSGRHAYDVRVEVNRLRVGVWISPDKPIWISPIGHSTMQEGTAAV